MNYPEWCRQFAQDVLDMRDAQRAYFAQPSDRRLKLSKLKEQKADEWLNKCLKAGIVAHKAKHKNDQPPLFT